MEIDTCKNAMSKARKDFENSKYFLHSIETQPLQNTYFHILKDSFNINRKFINPEDSVYYKCYDSVMTSKLKLKYGEKFLLKTKAIADSLEQTKNWISDPKYKYGYEKFKQELLEKLECEKSTSDRILISLTIDSNGEIIQSKIRSDLNLNNELKTNIINTVKKMGNWEPGFLYGKAVEKTINIPINLNE